MWMSKAWWWEVVKLPLRPPYLHLALGKLLKSERVRKSTLRVEMRTQTRTWFGSCRSKTYLTLVKGFVLQSTVALPQLRATNH